MSQADMATHVKKVYHNAPKWVNKVNAMSGKQVEAVYLDMKLKGRLK